MMGLVVGVLISMAATTLGNAPATPAVPPATVPFALQDVHLLGGPLKHSQDIAAEYLLSLEPDRLLARFRKEAGLEKKAENYPGWEEVQLPGVALGFYLSGASKLFATLGDKRFQDRVAYCLDELAACQQANGDGYLLATRDGKKLMADIAKGDIRLGGGWLLNGEPEPYYALEKLMSGLRDAYRHGGFRKALDIESGIGDWLEKHMAALNEQQLDTLIQVEYGGMNWVLSDLYADTGDARYLALSRRWHDKKMEDPLAKGLDCLPGNHANTQFPKISGDAARFPYTGDPADRLTAEFFWDRVVNHHSYVTGGNSEAEHFGPPDHLSGRLTASDTELCNSYNMVRLTQLLFAIKPKAEYADFVERVLFNHVLAAQHPADARICYFTPLISGCARTYQPLYEAFTCCTCSGLDSYAKHCEFVYMHDPEALFVNLFADSEVHWREKGVHIRQETRFPDEDCVRFSFVCDQPSEFTVNLRCPAWAMRGVAISVNGHAEQVSAFPSGYAAIKRTWQTGDRAEIRLPMPLHVEAMPDNPNKVAFFVGPILLAAEREADEREDDDNSISEALVSNGKALIEVLNPVEGKPLEFTLSGIARPKDFVLRPFFRLHDTPYVVYWDILTEGAWTANAKAVEERKAATADDVDRVRIGVETSESAHQMKGEKTASGNGAYGKHMRTRWRHAESGGWFSYEVAVLPHQANKISCRYWGRELGARKFEVVVDGTVVATESLDGNHPEAFYEAIYTIPEELVGDKSKVTVMFRPLPGNTAGGVFAVRVVK